MKYKVPLIVGNWKMHPQSLTAAKKLYREIKKELGRPQHVRIGIAPPSIYLAELSKLTNGKTIALAAQNVHWEKLGASTGEISLPMLQSIDVTQVILGHSERRAMGETDAVINKKVTACLKAGMTTILCVGEQKRDRNGSYFTFVENQVRKAVAGIPRTKLDNLTIAYEPIWAIGTGDTATAQDAQEMRLFIQKVLTNIYERNIARKVCILYGGSVNSKNAEELYVDGAVDGFLVGGASLRAAEFGSIVKSVASHANQ